MSDDVTEPPRPRRSFIFSPGLRPDTFPKALGFSGDGTVHPKWIGASNASGSGPA